MSEERENRIIGSIINCLETTMSKKSCKTDTKITDELEAMQKIWELVGPFPYNTQRRILDWVTKICCNRSEDFDEEDDPNEDY